MFYDQAHSRLVSCTTVRASCPQWCWWRPAPAGQRNMASWSSDGFVFLDGSLNLTKWSEHKKNKNKKIRKPAFQNYSQHSHPTQQIVKWKQASEEGTVLLRGMLLLMSSLVVVLCPAGVSRMARCEAIESLDQESRPSPTC